MNKNRHKLEKKYDENFTKEKKEKFKLCLNDKGEKKFFYYYLFLFILKLYILYVS